MAVIRDMPIVAGGLSGDTRIFTCSTGDSTSGAAINGAVVDLSAPGMAKNRFWSAHPWVEVRTTAGATSTADRTITIAVKLQHGDSSGGGDMADYSTGSEPTARTFFQSALTSSMLAWSTGTFRLVGPQAAYQLLGAKKFIRAVGTVTNAFGATSTAAGSLDRALLVNVGLTLGSADELLLRGLTTGPFTTATATA